MPKERLHILMAEEAFQLVQSVRKDIHLDGEDRLAYLMGSISPDSFFYDIPSFRLSRLGNDLHRFQGDAGASFFRKWINDESGSMPALMQAWILGMTSHFMADALWHPAIDQFSASQSPACRPISISPLDFHHWVESELEVFWLQRLRNWGAYVLLLKIFRRDSKRRLKYAGFVREFLLRAGLAGIPPTQKISRCIKWQVILLQQFAHPRWSRWRTWLLARKATQKIGALVVPLSSCLPSLPYKLSEEPVNILALSSPEFMAETVAVLANRLLSIPVRL